MEVSYPFVGIVDQQAMKRALLINAVAPTGINTPMISGYVEAYGEEMLNEIAELTGPFNLFGDGGMIEANHISEAYMWLSSDAARYVTGITFPVDAGMLAK